MVKIKAKSEQIKKAGYDHSAIELKWQSKWQLQGLYQPELDSANPSTSSGPSAFYNLMMFPYPSAEGLHIGGVRTFGGVDIYGRFQRMRGKEVFQPFGLDGFGIHAENYALKIGEHPMEHANVTEANYYRQVRDAGIGVDWSRTVETYKPEYYKWTQWLFLQLFNAGLAYRKKSPVNFCPSCKTVLADEQVIDGKCERCGSVVEKRDLEQWFFRITKYADRLLKNIESLNWTDKVRLAQRNWIGKREGSEIVWEIVDHEGEELGSQIRTFTTRRDTLPGVTFLVLAPESQYVPLVTTQEHKKAVEKYVSEAEDNLTREQQDRKKTGVFTGSYAKNPFNGKTVPIYVTDYVLGGYGTGAVMGMPGHDVRDRDFAKVFDLPTMLTTELPDGFDENAIYTGTGKQINTGKGYDGLPNKEAGEKIFSELVEQGKAKRSTQYHLRDWLISRQRYWGPPIPMIYCEKCAQRKPKVLLVHGLSGSSKENWFPWFKAELAKKGFEVLIPDLPNPDNPSLKDWIAALKQLGLSNDDKIFVVAHSLGAPAACQFILESGLKVQKLILVAPTGKEQSQKHWDSLIKNGCDPKGVEAIKDFNAHNIQLDVLRGYVNEASIYLSDNDPYIPVAVEKSYEQLQPTVHQYKNKGHFNAAAGVTAFPDILEEFPAIDELNLGWHGAPESDLPVKLPHIKDFKPLGTGKAPLANHPEFYKTTCPVCGSEARRETDVSDTFLDSAWYFLRYLATDWDDVAFPSESFFSERALASRRARPSTSSGNNQSAKARSRFLPVTMYIGGAEHSVLHLLYARFTTMVLHDLGYLDFEEPFARFYAHGLVIKDGAKMSKSKGNVITPDVYIKKFGADTVRTYLHFMGPFNQDGDFRDSGIEGMNRFLKRVWALLSSRSVISKDPDLAANRIMHQTVKGVTEDMEDLRFNTSLAKLMTWYNALAKQEQISQKEAEVYTQLLAPFAPHMTEELWEMYGHKDSVHISAWPEFEAKFITKDVVTIAIQVNGKLRTTFEVSTEQAKEQSGIEKAAREDEKVQKFLKEGTVRKVIYIPGKILNFVVA
jgi:leucyl-tRNA synthetase/predicted alpha/beta hydrolase family esterase